MIPAYLVTLGRWGTNLAFWPSMALLLTSWVIWPWWKSFWGINIISLDAAIALAIVGPVITYDFGFHGYDNLWFAWLEVSALWLVGFIIIWRGFLILSAQLQGTFGAGIGKLTWQLLVKIAEKINIKRSPPPPPPPHVEQQEVHSCPPQ